MESVIGQTFKDLEILCIDANSTDGTLEILREYEAKDDRIKVILSDRKSYGYQVNLGIQMASGNYIGIIETDDIAEKNMVQWLYDTITRENADYVKGTFQIFAMIGGKRSTQNFPMIDWNDEEEERIILPIQREDVLLWDSYLWNGLYKADFVKKIKLNESSGAAYQDFGFNYQVYTQATKAVYIKKTVYNYRQDNRENSCASTKAFQYIMQEWEYINKLSGGVPERYVSVLYNKILGMINTYVRKMGMTKSYWRETEKEIERLRLIMCKACSNHSVMEYCQKTYGNILDMFLESPYKLFEFYKASYSEKEEVFKKIVSLSEPYVIFGAGNFGKFVHITLMGLEKQIAAFCDNDRERWGRNIQGTFVMSMEDAVQKYPQATYIAASKKYADELETQLINAGITKGQIVKYTQGCEEKMFFLHLQNQEEI